MKLNFVLASENSSLIQYQTSFNLGRIVFQLRLTSEKETNNTITVFGMN